MNASPAFSIVIVKQLVLTMTDHSPVPATLGLQEMESRVQVYTLSGHIFMLCSTSFFSNQNQMLQFKLKEICHAAEYQYMNMHFPPPINVLVTVPYRLLKHVNVCLN